MRIEGEELRKKYSIDDEWEFIGYNSITKQPVYICSRDFLLIEKLKHFHDEYEVKEFENDEVNTPDFKTYAVNWATGFLKCFISFEDAETQKKENSHENILKFVKNGKYGECESFKIDGENRFSILIVPGGYIYTYQSFECFVSYEQVIKELAIKQNSMPISGEKIQ